MSGILIYYLFMNRSQEVITKELRLRGALYASDLATSLGVSQPTISRLLSGMRSEGLITIGKARSSRYAMRRPLAEQGSIWPLYTINEDASASLVGQLHALEARQWYLSQDKPWNTLRATADFRNGIFPGIPWFLYDLRPQGFLGRSFAQTYATSLGGPLDPRLWSDDIIISALIRFGQDLPGNFILGESMLAAAQMRMLSAPNAIPAQERENIYPQEAENILTGQLPGSSAGGEQPKFTTCIKNNDGTVRHVIVKFSGAAGRPEDERWADLLHAEHIANTVLSENNIPSADTCIIKANGRTFLESTRFDRKGNHGRRGLTSLEALDSAFFGELNTPWTAAAKRLSSEGWLSEDQSERLTLLWWFGTLIGNSDMHYGNISLFLNATSPLELAPTYDMTAMRYRPNAEGILSNDPLSPPPPPPESLNSWGKAAIVAKQFWSQIAETTEVSQTFRDIAEQNIKVISCYRQQF